MNSTPKQFGRSLMLSAAALLLFSGCLASSDSPDVTLERANILADRGKYDDAIPVYSKAIESFSERADVYYRRGVCYENLQLFDKALADYTKCLELDPLYADAINNKGVVLAQMQQFQAAADQFSLLVEKYPDNVLALRNRGLCLHDLQKYEDAIRDYDKAIELDETDPQTWFQKGNVLLEQHLLQDAIVNYDKAIELDPAYAKAWMNRGVARFNLGNKQEAMAELRHASELNENIVIPDINWGETAPAADIVLLAKPVDAVDSLNWSVCETFARTFLLEQGFAEITIRKSFAELKCAVFTATRNDQPHDIYVGYEQADQQVAVSLPVVEQPAEGSKTSLLILKQSAAEGEQQQQLKVAQFDQEWDYSAAVSKPIVIELNLKPAK